LLYFEDYLYRVGVCSQNTSRLGNWSKQIRSFYRWVEVISAHFGAVQEASVQQFVRRLKDKMRQVARRGCVLASHSHFFMADVYNDACRSPKE
jgi:hypothetical protein